MRHVALVLALSAALAGCAGLEARTPQPDVQSRLDELARAQSRAEMRMDEITQTVLVLKDRMDVQEMALKRAKEEWAPQDDLAVPPLQVVKVEPLPRPVPDAEANEASTSRGPSVEAPSKGTQQEELPKAGLLGAPAADLYRRAFSAFREGRFGHAILDFEDFVRRYPDHEYADNAQYWIGECYYSQREFGESIVEFGRVVERFPRERKAPDALLKIGLAYQQLGDAEKARAFWRRVPAEYPSSEAAVQARRLLSPPP